MFNLSRYVHFSSTRCSDFPRDYATTHVRPRKAVLFCRRASSPPVQCRELHFCPHGDCDRTNVQKIVMNRENKGKQPFHAYHDPSPSAYPAPTGKTPDIGSQQQSQATSLTSRIAQSASSLARSAIAGPSSGAVHGNELVSSLNGLGGVKASGSSSSSIATSSQHGDVGRYEVKHGDSGAQGFRTQSSMPHEIKMEEIQAMLDEFDPSSGSMAPFTSFDICKMGIYRSPSDVPVPLDWENFWASTHPNAKDVSDIVLQGETPCTLAEWRDQQLANGFSLNDDQMNRDPSLWRASTYPEDAIWSHDPELIAWVRENHPLRPWSSRDRARWTGHTEEEEQRLRAREREVRNRRVATRWMELRRKRGPASAEDQERWEFFINTLPSGVGGIEKWEFDKDQKAQERVAKKGKRPVNLAQDEERKGMVGVLSQALGNIMGNGAADPKETEKLQEMTELDIRSQQMTAAWQNATSRHDINVTSEWDNQSANIPTISHHSTTAPSHDIATFASHDGDDVLAILNDPSSFTSTDDLTISIADTATPSADDLSPDAAPPVALFSTQSNDAHDFAATAAPESTSPSSTLRRLTTPGADLSDPVAWLQDWERALTHYTDDVWDPASFPWVQEAREAIVQVVASEEVKSGDGAVIDNAGAEAREKALGRLRMIVGHVRIADSGSTKMSMYAIPGAR